MKEMYPEWLLENAAIAMRDRKMLMTSTPSAEQPFYKGGVTGQWQTREPNLSNGPSSADIVIDKDRITKYLKEVNDYNHKRRCLPKVNTLMSVMFEQIRINNFFWTPYFKKKDSLYAPNPYYHRLLAPLSTKEPNFTYESGTQGILFNAVVITPKVFGNLNQLHSTLLQNFFYYDLIRLITKPSLTEKEIEHIKNTTKMHYLSTPQIKALVKLAGLS